jgi:hypothetical protein
VSSTRSTAVAALAALLTLGGCAGTVETISRLTPPRVFTRGVRLVEAPSASEIEAVLCAKGATCTEAARDPAPVATRGIVFDVDLDIQNANYVPMPVSEILVGLTAFPDGLAERTGAACLLLCPAGDDLCRKQGPGRPCEGARRGVPSTGDYGGPLADLLAPRGLASVRGEPLPLEVIQLPARATVPITARFTFVRAALVDVLVQAARRAPEVLRPRNGPAVLVPFEIDGAVFVRGGRQGERLAQAFGPFRGAWPLPTALARRN